MDEMIQLHHGAKPVPKTSLPNVRRVVYNRLEDIPFLLRTDASNTATAGLRADAAPFVPTRAGAGAEPSQPESEEPAADEVPEEDRGEDDIIEEGVDLENITQAIDAAQSTVAAPVALTAEEIAAGEKIAALYQQYVARTRLQKKHAGEEVRRRVFAEFHAQSAKMEWPHRYYRMLFLGPLPHLYIAVQNMKNHVHEARSAAKKKFNIVKHLELETMQSSLTQMKYVP